MPEKILVVDDEPSIVTLVSVALQRAGYTVISAQDGLEALEMAQNEHPSLILLDVMLPGLDGFAVCERIRKTETMPIIMITARNSEMEKVWGLEVGADDYVTKPFSPRELVARVKAVLRRTTPDTGSSASLSSHNITIDLLRHRAYQGGNPLDLTPKEFDLLATLMQSKGRAFSRDELLLQLWGYEYAGGTRTVDVHVRRLRQKLGDDPNIPAFIETVHGVGYRWKDELNA